MIYLYYTDRFLGYNFGPEHPLNPVRLMLTYKLIEDFGFLDCDDAELVEPRPASEEDLLLIHTQDSAAGVSANFRQWAMSHDWPVQTAAKRASRRTCGSGSWTPSANGTAPPPVDRGIGDRGAFHAHFEAAVAGADHVAIRQERCGDRFAVYVGAARAA